MGRMKDLFIAMMEEDWEHLSQKEKAIIKAEQEHMEQQMMQEQLAEEQQAAEIQVIKVPPETKENDRDKAKNDSLPF